MRQEKYQSLYETSISIPHNMGENILTILHVHGARAILVLFNDDPMYIDIFYVNRIPFFLSKTGKLNFLSGTKLKSRSGREIILTSITRQHL